MAKEQFKDLSVGDKFIFEGEIAFPYSGLAKGPWVKTSPRCYVHVEDAGTTHQVGSISAEVIRNR